MLKLPGTHIQKLLGGIRYHRYVRESHKKDLCSRPRGASLHKWHQSLHVTTQFLKMPIPLKCRISSTAYCGRLREVPWPEHTMVPRMGSPLHGGWQQQGGGGQGSQAPNGHSAEDWETPEWVQGLLRHLTVNSPHYIPKAAFARPEELHKYLTPRRKKKQETQSTCRE